MSIRDRPRLGVQGSGIVAAIKIDLFCPGERLLGSQGLKLLSVLNGLILI